MKDQKSIFPKKLSNYIESLTFVLSVLVALSLFGAYHHVLELLSHFTFQYVFLFVIYIYPG
ncbi:hypothetical protein MJH12_15170 [bacterium]|nr:hypothetical protein [bacterium]